MTPVVCRVKHDPENGTYGDCLRACVATILDFDAEQVPHFADGNASAREVYDALTNWLSTFNLVPFYSCYPGSASRDDMLEMMGELNPTATYMLFGSTVSGDHVVVCQGGQVVHDPAWYGTGLIGPGSNTFWTVVVIARK